MRESIADQTNSLFDLKSMSTGDIDVLDEWWVQKSRRNFFAFRQYMRYGNFIHNWFIARLCFLLQSFYTEFLNGERPILVISTPPQHGKSWVLGDFIAWISGLDPTLRTIYGSYSDILGTRCNLLVQRFMDHPKYSKIFPGTKLPEKKGVAVRTSNLLEFVGEDGETHTTGQFRNTTVAGAVTGESLDIGALDDPLKGREQANSAVYRDKIWEWITDDFGTRFSEYAGLLITATRWNVDDPIGRLVDKEPNTKFYNFSAIAIEDEKYRKTGEPLFPALKSSAFLKKKKGLMKPDSWESLYQGNPTVPGGNLFKDEDWKWWDRLPKLKFTFIVADTAQKKKTINDWTCFQLWGYGMNDCIYLMAQFHEKIESPELRREAAAFYHDHNTPRKNVGDPILRGFYIEDKSSGSGLIQELKRKKLKVHGVQRSTDKIERSSDCIPEIEAGRVYLNENVSHVGVITQEGREFPNGKFDDAIDTVMNAIEVAFIHTESKNSLQAAMEAD